MNKARDGMSAKLFQILKDGAVKEQHSICQQLEKTKPFVALFLILNLLPLTNTESTFHVPSVVPATTQNSKETDKA